MLSSHRAEDARHFGAQQSMAQMSAQISLMLRTDKEVLLSLVQTEANTRSNTDLLWQELRKLHCTNHRLALENDRLRRRIEKRTT